MLWRLIVIILSMSNLIIETKAQETTECAQKTTEKIHPYFTIPHLPNTFRDVFKPSMGGKPMLGTTGATCWARGGICVDLRDCPAMRFDVAVSGCTRGFKVCCKSFKLHPPTVGLHRRENTIQVFSSDMKELEDDAVKSVMEQNDNLISYIRRSQSNGLY